MALFEKQDWSRTDLSMLQNGSVHLYWRPSVLAADLASLADLGYQLIELDAASWSSAADLHRDVAAALEFPTYYGRNMDAFNDCLGDVALGDYGWRSDSAGLVLVLRRFDAFVAADRPTAQLLLDVFAGRARIGALFGHQLLCLVQSDDPTIHLEPVGAQAVTWNRAEWLTAERER
ncbi:barstar family protein [Aquihabitans sp. McL0605]|uniref:barstar family protein n=1 Tax=Aquihabitans sp. McL0605 TaxID=3415671 RepID=UPI003CEBD59C